MKRNLIYKLVLPILIYSMIGCVHTPRKEREKSLYNERVWGVRDSSTRFRK